MIDPFLAKSPGPNSRIVRLAIVALALAAAFTAIGCRPTPSISPAPRTAQNARTDADDLTLALESLRRLAEGQESQPFQRTIFYLNQWISSDKAAEGQWQQDKLLDTMPRALRNTPGLEELDRLQFTQQDVPHLQQTLWLHDVAQRVRRQPSPPELAAWLREMETRVGLPESEQLAAAERLFDWTIRNIQLDPLPPAPRSEVATAGPGSEAIVPAAMGEVGPGYSQVPLQVLLHGHGDAYERARIFILLCRQAGVEAVMLGLPDPRSTAVTPWVPAAFIGGDLYLFDTGLGLPIPGAGQVGIATLAQAADDPAVLRQLDLPEQPPYAVDSETLRKGVVALFDAEPGALTRRMQLLQGALPASRRLVLSTRPSELEPKLRIKFVRQGTLWRVPFEAIIYQYGRLQKAQHDPEAFMALQQEQMLFSPATPLSRGRNLHLQGEFAKRDQEPGARSLYLDARPADSEIDAMVRNDYVREKMGLKQQLPQDPQQQALAIQNIKTIMVTSKQNATYWMALTYYETGNYKAAVEWLTERTLSTVPPSPWTAGARYNLARCYEEIGQFDLARRWLESDAESPQRHGNLLRAKWLAETNDADKSDTGQSDAGQDNPSSEKEEPQDSP